MVILLPHFMMIRNPEQQRFMEALLDEYGTLMLSTAKKMLTREDAAEDVVQESLVKLIGHIERLMEIPRCNLAGYLVNTVKNTARNYLNAEAVRTRRSAERTPEKLPEDQGDDRSAEWIVIRRENRSGFYEVWDTLAEADQRLLRDKYILGKSNEEIAGELGCGTDSVRMKLTRARRRAMEAYKEWKSDDQT